MFHAGDVRAHGGQGAVAGRVRPRVQVGAILRASDAAIRVWNGAGGRSESFSVAEARDLCRRADIALGHRSDEQLAGLVLDDANVLRPLIVTREWLIAFCAAVRRELRKADAAGARS